MNDAMSGTVNNVLKKTHYSRLCVNPDITQSLWVGKIGREIQ